jgi:hypothetical protein
MKTMFFVLITLVLCYASDLQLTAYGETFHTDPEGCAYLDTKLVYNNSFVNPFISFMNYTTDFSEPMTGVGISKNYTYKNTYWDGFVAMYDNKSIRIGIFASCTIVSFNGGK